MKTREISDFFKNDLTDYACYSTLRMIASAIDGLKNSSRKIIYTTLDKNIKNETKVTVYDNLVISHTQYLHGTCAGVIVNLACDYTGSNNLPLLCGKGNFGTRFTPEPSAPRYIYAKSQTYLDTLYDIKDVLNEQYFEGDKIEPQFYVPSLPILAVNGSMNGLASGFKQHILPRKISEIIKYIRGEKADLVPYFKGFKGSIRRSEGENTSNVQWEFLGSISINKNKVHITELPPQYDYSYYINILDDLEDSKKIKSYKDNSDQRNQTYDFEVTLFEPLEEEKVFNLLKLIKKETEIYNALDEKNQVKTFNNINEIIDYYLDVRKRYMILQQEFLNQKYQKELDIISNKLRFIKMIIDDELKVMKRPKADIEQDLIKNNFNKVDDSFNYLLNMQIHSFTNETLKKLSEEALKTREIFEKNKSMDTFKEYLSFVKKLEKLEEN